MRCEMCGRFRNLRRRRERRRQHRKSGKWGFRLEWLGSSLHAHPDAKRRHGLVAVRVCARHCAESLWHRPLNCRGVQARQRTQLLLVRGYPFEAFPYLVDCPVRNRRHCILPHLLLASLQVCDVPALDALRQQRQRQRRRRVPVALGALQENSAPEPTALHPTVFGEEVGRPEEDLPKQGDTAGAPLSESSISLENTRFWLDTFRSVGYA